MIFKQKENSSSLMIFLSYIRRSQLFWICTFSILTALAAQVSVPTQPVPFTLQTLLVVLSGAFLGSRNGAYSQVVYLLAGVIGIPVFAGYSFGIERLFGPTGGYLLSFPFAAFFVGYILEKKSNSFFIALAFFLGQLLTILIGATYLSVFMNGNFYNALFSGAIIFTIWDIIKTVAAFSIYKSISKKIPKLP